MLIHVITNFTARAGAEKMLARLLKVSDGERVIVVSLMGVSEHNRKLADNQQVEFIALGATSAPQLVGTILSLARIIRRERPDVILCWMYHAMAIGSLAKMLSGSTVPLVWTIRQSLDDPTSLSSNSRLALKMCAYLSSRAQGIIYNSSRAMQLHQDYGFRHNRAVFIPNGFEPSDAKAPPASQVRVFGIAGRLHPQKDHTTFFRAAKIARESCPEIRFVAVGDGLNSENPTVQSMLAESGLPRQSIYLQGEVSNMSEFYHEIDAFVLSSRTEGFPNVVAEAMSYGKPVVATDVGDAASIVGDTGLVVPPRDPGVLATAIVFFARMSKTEYSARSMASRKRIEAEYSLKHISKEYERFLSSFV